MADGTDEVYEIEKIVKKRLRKGKTEYLIKWKDYPEEENTWETEDNIFAKDMLEEFNKQNEANKLSSKRKTNTNNKKKIQIDSNKNDVCVNSVVSNNNTKKNETNLNKNKKIKNKNLNEIVNKYVKDYLKTTNFDLNSLIKEVNDIKVEDDNYFVSVIYIDDTEGEIPYEIFKREAPSRLFFLFESRFFMDL